MKYHFGPVKSRRLGVSLGVDLVPYKTCSLNCVYCECGNTTDLTTEIAEYVPTDEVIAELDSYCASSPRLDVITFSGSGEPTLHAGIGRIIGHIKDRYPQYRVAVLTNGTMLREPAVRQAILRADVVVPSLDAVGSEAFARICRPRRGVTPESVVRGLVDFRKEFSGTLYLEIFIVPGVNDGAGELARLKMAAEEIAPDKVQINSLDRPGAADWVRPMRREELDAIAELFRPLPVEVIGRPAAQGHAAGREGDVSKSIVSILRRRPSTIDDLMTALGLPEGELAAVLDSLAAAGMVTVERLDRGDFYRMV
jgi:wyosine [tRNA(Phe)-imidazoG37] synthetase (radical SAM superfamily)